MTQLPLFENSLVHRVVNVASVPKRSPFRYPGGKTWLVPLARLWLARQDSKPNELLEPFAGGGIIGLTAVFEGLASSVTFVELDRDVASVWETTLSEDSAWLINRILEFEITEVSVKEELNKPPQTTRERAFKTLLKNRVYHGGILAPGSGLIKYGESGRGIKSRWYPNTIVKRIDAIYRMRNRIKFIEGDGLEVLSQYKPKIGSIYFMDPPYTAGGKKAGTRLYTFNELDHAKLFALAESLAGDFLMTYDDSHEVITLAITHGFETVRIPMNGTRHSKLYELLVSRHFEWVS